MDSMQVVEPLGQDGSHIRRAAWLVPDGNPLAGASRGAAKWSPQNSSTGTGDV